MTDATLKSAEFTALSRLSADIDLNAEGKATGFVRVPHSVHRSAYGWIPIPIVRIKNGDGPNVLMQAGNHGDEWEGQIGLGNLIRSIEPKDIKGRLVILPSANFPAAMEGRRTSPIDEGNLNRSFPGDAEGTITQQIAYWIEHALLPGFDYAFDFHSGGSSLTYIPSARAPRHQSGAPMRPSRAPRPPSSRTSSGRRSRKSWMRPIAAISLRMYQVMSISDQAKPARALAP